MLRQEALYAGETQRPSSLAALYIHVLLLQISFSQSVVHVLLLEVVFGQSILHGLLLEIAFGQSIVHVLLLEIMCGQTNCPCAAARNQSFPVVLNAFPGAGRCIQCSPQPVRRATGARLDADNS